MLFQKYNVVFTEVMYKMRITSEQEMIQIGVKIASLNIPTIVCSLQGDLGAGKTQLTKGIALGLGIQDVVTSPTFSLIHEYEGKNPLLHIDLYRISSTELQAIDLEEIIENSTGWTVVEWGNLHPHILPSNYVVFNISIEGECRILNCLPQGTEEFQSNIIEQWATLQ